MYFLDLFLDLLLHLLKLFLDISKSEWIFSLLHQNGTNSSAAKWLNGLTKELVPSLFSQLFKSKNNFQENVVLWL